ncbi:MAG: hypothetical protein ACP5N0_07685 [Methanosarcina sp.]
MTSSKSENSTSSSHPSGSEARENREKALAGKITPTYESATFSRPVVDQLNGIMPDFNRRLSPEKDLGLSSQGHSRLSPETLPRLVSDSCAGLSFSEFPKTLSGAFEMPVGKGFEIKPDLAGRTLSGAKACSMPISADLLIAPLGSRFVNLRQAEDSHKRAEKDPE